MTADPPGWVARIVAGLLVVALLAAAFLTVVASAIAQLGAVDAVGRYVRSRLMLGGTLPAVLGAFAAGLTWVRDVTFQRTALATVAGAGALVLVAGPLTWSPPPADGGLVFRANPWLEGDWVLLTLWSVIVGLLAVALLAWRCLRVRTRALRRTDPARTPIELPEPGPWDPPA